MIGQTLHENEQMQLLFQVNPVFREHSMCHRDLTTIIKNTCHTTCETTHYTQIGLSVSWISWLLQKIYKGFLQNIKTLTLLTHQQVRFDWTPLHHTALLSLKEAIIQVPMLCYPDPNKNIFSTQMHLMMHVEHNFHRT